MNLRLQTTGKGSNRVMKKGFKALKKMIQSTESKFEAEVARFKAAAAVPSKKNKKKAPKKRVAA